MNTKGDRAWPLVEAASGDRRRIRRSCEHRWPRGLGGAHPGRISCARNVETPSRSGLVGSGRPIARGANPSAGQDAQEADAGAPKGDGSPQP